MDQKIYFSIANGFNKDTSLSTLSILARVL